MTVEAWTYLVVTVSFLCYLYIGWKARVRETAGFYVAGHGVPPLANGAATAADWMSAASFISMAGMISAMGYDGSIYLMGWTGGYVLLALLLAPYLRKFGKYTVPDFVGDRYDSNVARVIAVVCALFVSITYVAGQMRGVGIVFSRFMQVDVETGVVVGMIIVAFFAVLGGMKGITWTQVAQYAVLIAAFMLPAIAISWQLTGIPAPQIAFAAGDIVPRLDALHRDLGFAAYTEPFATTSKLNVLLITLALMAGTAGLPHVIVRFYTVPSVRDARWSAGWALLFIALLYTTAPALAAFARFNLIDTLHGKTPAAIAQEGWPAKWQATGLLTLEDKNGDGVLTMAKDAAANEIVLDRDIVVLSTPEVARLAPWVIALVAAGGLAAALSTASGLLLVISSAIAHDLYFRLINPKANEAHRVNVGRVMVIAAVLAAGYAGVNPPGFVAQVVAFAFGLAAASFFPVILMGIFDRRANKYGAIAGMTAGLGFTVAYIVGTKADLILPVSGPFFGPWCFGITAEGIGAVGMLLHFAVAFAVSRLTAPPPPHIAALLDSLRAPDHAGPAVILDEATE